MRFPLIPPVSGGTTCLLLNPVLPELLLTERSEITAVSVLACRQPLAC